MIVLVEKLKPLCKSIIVVYTHYVRDKVSEGDLDYIETGVDSNLETYKELFFEILGLALGVKDVEPKINKKVKEETIIVIKRELSRRKYRGLANNYRLLIYTTCELIFNKVMEEIKNDYK